jgi:hypothetical protein
MDAKEKPVKQQNCLFKHLRILGARIRLLDQVGSLPALGRFGTLLDVIEPSRKA